MIAQNLVLEVGEDESAADVQSRLNTAAEDGFFLVNVVGKLAFLRKSITQPKNVTTPGAAPVNTDAAAAISHALKGLKRITLRNLRVAACFVKFPAEEWYRALDSLSESGHVHMDKETTLGGKVYSVVFVDREF